MTNIKKKHVICWSVQRAGRMNYGFGKGLRVASCLFKVREGKRRTGEGGVFGKGVWGWKYLGWWCMWLKFGNVRGMRGCYGMVFFGGSEV
jgi:hypothetical protein